MLLVLNYELTYYRLRKLGTPIPLISYKARSSSDLYRPYISAIP